MNRPSVTTPLGATTMSPALKNASNYYSWIAGQFTGRLGGRVLDIGGGHGPLLEHVVSSSQFTMSVDLDSQCVTDLRSRFAGMSFAAEVGDITEAEFERKLAAVGFDSILCVNVLEHIENDQAALDAMARILADNGVLCLLVPAHQFLYGSPDVLAGHFRRYSRGALAAKVARAGFTVERDYYFNAVGTLPYLVNSRIFPTKTLAGAVDRQIVLFDRFIVPVARRVEKLFPVPFGQSAIVVARRKRDA